jgi:hypothetical protein
MASLSGRTLYHSEPGVAVVTLLWLLLPAACARQDAVRPGGDPGTPALDLSASSDPASAFYASPSGSPGGDGSMSSPWDLQTALDHPAAVQPGDTIWLRGGTYAAAMYVSNLTGTAVRPIIVRQYPGERATIDGGTAGQGLVTRGAHTWFWGLEVMGSSGQPILVYNSVGDRFINLVVHDAGKYGIAQFTWTGARQTEIHGCIVYNNGREHNLDHGFYVQNDVATGMLYVTDNIIFNNWARGIQAYAKVGTQRETISGIVIEGNVAFHNGSISVPVNHTKQIMVGGMVPGSDIIVRSNYTYGNAPSRRNADALSLNIGYTWGPDNEDVVVENNYIVGGLYVGKWASALVRGNVVYDYDGPMVVTEPNVSGHTWNANRFYGDATTVSWMHVPNAPTDAATWKAQAGFLTPGGYAGSGAPPNHVVVRPNKYEAGRANIIVYNWERRSTVSVDVSGVLDAGDRYVVQNVQDFYGPPVASGTYDGSALQLPMAGITPPAPIGTAAYTPAPVTGPTFNVFVLMRAP